MEGETQGDRKSRLAEMAKAIKAKKADISKSLEKVNSEVKKSLAVQETVRKARPTVLEEVARQEHEETAVVQEVEETRGKSGVIRRRVKAPVPGAPEPVVVRAKAPEPAPVARVEPEEEVVRPARVEARTPAVVAPKAKVAPVAEVAKPIEMPVEKVVARSTPVETEDEPEVEVTKPIRVPVPEVTKPVQATRPIARESEPMVVPAAEVKRPMAPVSTPASTPVPMAASSASAASQVALIKRAGKDVTPAGLTFTPTQPSRVGPPRPEGSTTTTTSMPERGSPIPGTERKGPGAGKQIFELKELTFGPGQLHGGRRKRVIPKKQQQKTQITTPKAIKKRIAVEGGITVGALAQRMAVKVGDVMKKLMSMGMMATMNQTIDADTATLVAAEFGFEVSNVEFKEEDLLGAEATEADVLAVTRAPVVTIMGHVDHGKTSLLDAIRKTKVADGEAGGITQHIGAYTVKVDGRAITFLDTPGHEAFSAMRARGADVTDIVILVCAVDDGAQPQTLEAIQHAKLAGVPIIVALNKIDKPGTDADKIMQSLTQHGLVPEAWGGETMFVKTSAKTGIGIKELLETILLRADVMELKANPVKPAVGTIVEAKIDKGRGPVATVLVQEGTLKVGDAIVSGSHFGKVRAMSDDKGKPVKEAGPSTPVEVLGLSGVPDAGDSLHVAADVDAAKQVAEHRTAKARENTLGAPRKMSMENIFGAASSAKELHVIVKADVQGSVEALRNALERLSTEKVTVKVVGGSVGAISESDVLLATASKAMIVGFNVKPDNRGREMADQEHIDVRSYSIIYEALDDVRVAMVGMLEPIFRETPLGKAEVRNLFTSSKVGAVAGCMVIDGKIKRNAKVRVVRGGKVLWDGKIGSLKRFKDDAGEVTEGFECGLAVDGFSDVQVGDEIHCYGVEQIAATL